VYWGIGGESERSLCVVKNSHSNNSLVVGLDNDRGFFSGFGVSTLYSCAVIVFSFLLQACYFPTVVSRASVP